MKVDVPPAGSLTVRVTTWSPASVQTTSGAGSVDVAGDPASKVQLCAATLPRLMSSNCTLSGRPQVEVQLKPAESAG